MYGRKRYQRPINPAFKAGVEVDYQSGYGLRGLARETDTETLKIDRVLGTGHAIVRIPNRDDSFREVKFQITGQDYAYEVGDSNYKASIRLRTEAYMLQRASQLAYAADQQRRKHITNELRELPIYGLTNEQLDVLEGIINSFKTAK